jgi:GNAT superfamily N-acetyltransferase
MLFCGTDLALRVERAEQSMLEECVGAIAQRDSVRDLFALPIAGGLATFAGADSPMTKVAGLGFGGVPTTDEIAQIEKEFFARGAAVQVELCNLAESGVGERFTQRGYALVGFENVLGRALKLSAPHVQREGIAVQRSGDAELEAWIDVVITGFASPDTQGVASHESFPRDAAERAIREVTRARGFVRYLARRENEVAGGASMRLSNGVAQLCGAATLPKHRRRGVQSALLEQRLFEAGREGCDIAVVTTLPGSKSQQNVQKQGFELLYTRAILRRTP